MRNSGYYRDRTDMKVEAELKTLFVFRANNRCTYLGCFYPEDDWDIIMTAETLPKLEDMVTKEAVRTGICLESPQLYTSEHLIYGNSTFDIGKRTDMDARAFWNKIEHSDLYKSLKEAKKIEKKIQDAKERQKHDIKRLDEIDRERERLIAGLSGTGAIITEKGQGEYKNG